MSNSYCWQGIDLFEMIKRDHKVYVQQTLHLDRRAGDLHSAGAIGNLDDLLSARELSQWFGVSVQWLERGRAKAYGPPFIKLGPYTVRYRRDSTLHWLKEREQCALDRDFAPRKKAVRRVVLLPASERGRAHKQASAIIGDLYRAGSSEAFPAITKNLLSSEK